jgi:hypothetical protein
MAARGARLWFGWRQLIAARCIRWGHVDVQGPEQLVAGVLDFMLISMFDKEECAGAKRVTLAVHQCRAGARDDIEPLIGPPVAVLRVPLSLTGWDDHLGRLGAGIAEDDPKAFPEAEMFALHGGHSFRE